MEQSSLSDRIKKETADLIGFPPIEWTTKSIAWLIEQETFLKNFHRVPVLPSLVDSLKKYKMINPILVMPTWYPIVGSQRLRACRAIYEEDNEHSLLQQVIRVARFEKEYWNSFYLWPNVEERNKCVQIYFQTIEAAWKSVHFIVEEDPSGVPMRQFEIDGDNLKWRDRDGS